MTLKDITELDIAALQVVCAAERDAAKSGILFALEGSASDEISTARTDDGLMKFEIKR